jgi:hypothetical protein
MWSFMLEIEHSGVFGDVPMTTADLVCKTTIRKLLEEACCGRRRDYRFDEEGTKYLADLYE